MKRVKEKILVTIEGKKQEFDKYTSLFSIAESQKKNYEYDIILAVVDNKLRELNYVLTKDCKVSFLTTADETGSKAYMRGLIFVMLKAIYSIVKKENIEKIWVEYSLGSGYYCEIEGKQKLTKEILQKVEDKMRQLVRQDILFEKKRIDTQEAIELFHKLKMYEKEELFQYRKASNTNIYDLDGFQDYFYGYMPYSTGILKYFKLWLYEDGFILQLPNKKTPQIIEKEPTILPKLFTIMKESGEWGRMMEVHTVGALNNIIAAGEIQNLILIQEALQEKKIAQLAEQIKQTKGKKFIMIAGPSSSGKTTFSYRLSIQLRTYGLKPHPIAIDDYFLNREDTPLDENGNYNFECLEAIDIEKFNQDMIDLLNGKTVEIPTFNFKIGKREYKGNYKKLGTNDILVIEGIHGLNDKLSYSLPRESKFKIYISALTQLNIDEHNRIPTTDGRLLRRIVRDARTRGTLAKDTIAMWSSVRKGEEEYIFPFQEDADVMFNSASVYELAVLKQYAEPNLFGIDKNTEEYIEAKRLLKFLDYFIGVSTEDIPKNSIIREFIGGSCFKV